MLLSGKKTAWFPFPFPFYMQTPDSKQAVGLQKEIEKNYAVNRTMQVLRQTLLETVYLF